jgi:uncharacterized protein HemX
LATPLNRRIEDKWHVGKEIPIVLIMAVLAQTAGGIWWMSQMSAKIDNAVLSISELKSERYTREDARRDRELLDQKIKAMESRDTELERRINSNDSRMDRVERK